VRSSDPFADVEISRRRGIEIAIATALLAVLWSMVFPEQAAIIAVILSLFTIIMLHEFGHFIMAKRAGMKVTEFFVGFGPRIWSFRRGETEYGLKAVPLGGYCKIVGMTSLEEVAPEDEPRAYRSKTWGQKVSTVVAGPMVHFIIAFVLMFTVLFIAGDYRHGHDTTTLGAVSQGAAAPGALQTGDKILAVRGVPITSWDAQVPKLVTDDGKAKAGDVVSFLVLRNGEQVPVRVTLQRSTDAAANGRIVAGIKPTYNVPHPGVAAALAQTPRQVFDYSWESVKAVGSMFSPSGISNYFQILSGSKSKSVNQNGRFVSVVGIGQLANDAVKAGWVTVFGLLIMLNIFFGLFNLLPMFPFDGGFIAVASYEAVASFVRRRKVQVDVTKLVPLTIAVFAVLGFIGITSIFLDITHPMANPF
jgi:membrane-associated protease RseP (regulator of RpoE activity)